MIPARLTRSRIFRLALIYLCLFSTAVLALIGFVAATILTREVVSSVVVAVTLVLVVICGTLFGSVLPLIFKRLGLDPALMSNPFVAGIIDILGIVIYMNVALLLMSMTGGAAESDPGETSFLFFPR